MTLYENTVVERAGGKRQVTRVADDECAPDDPVVAPPAVAAMTAPSDGSMPIGVVAARGCRHRPASPAAADIQERRPLPAGKARSGIG